MNSVEFKNKLVELGFKETEKNSWSKLDKIKVKMYNDENVKVLKDETSKIFAYLDVYDRVLDYIAE